MLCLFAFIQLLFTCITSKNYTEIFTNSTALLNLIKYDNKDLECLSIKENSFLIHGNKKYWLDRYTESIVRSYVRCRYVYKSTINNIPDGPFQIISLFDNHSNKYILALEDSNFIVDIKKIFPTLQNPAFIIWNGYFVISWRIRRSIVRINYIPIKSLLNNNNNNNNNNTSYTSTNLVDTILDNLQHVNFRLKNLSHLAFHGEDPRLIQMNDKLFIVYSMRFKRTIPEIWMYYSELYFNEYQQLQYKSKININFKSESNQDQKNWSPFINNNKLLFITHINPEHNIAETIHIPNYLHVEGKTIASSNNNHNSNNLNITELWKWGEIRGGTPCLLIDNNTYLSFFHSSNIPNKTYHWLQTYVFGAYTFCSKSPYRILKISSKPIIHHSMYEGPWLYDPIAAAYIDYVVFPMSFMIENGYIYLSYGSQDKDGWVIKMDYKQLYNSLIDINLRC